MAVVSKKSYSKKSNYSSGKASASNAITPDDLLKKLKNIKDDKRILTKDSSLGTIFKDHGISNQLIFFGSQPLRIKRTLSWIRENFLTPRNSHLSTYFGTEFTNNSSIQPLADSLSSMSMFEKTEVVVIQEVDKIKAAPAKILLPIVSRKNSDTLIVLCAAEIKGELLETCVTTGTCVEFSDLPLAMLGRWIEREVSINTGPSGIDSDARDLLARTYSNDLGALSKIIEHLAALTPNGKTITARLAREFFSRAPEVQSFDLMKELSRKNISASQNLLTSLIDQGFHPLQLVAFLNRASRTLLATSASQTALDQAPELKHPWFTKQLQPAKSGLTTSDLSKTLEELARLDFKLKDSKLPESLNTSVSLLRIGTRKFINS